jgi:signal peptidase I
MHSTPVYRNDEPRSASVDHIWAIGHGRSNISEPLSGAAAAGIIISNSVQQNWDRDAAGRLIAQAGALTSYVRVSSLAFRPDNSVRDYLSARESEPYVLASQAAASLLADEQTIIITAGGYSMWPAIQPGDRVILSPCHPADLSAGDVVAASRDGGFVVHRITEIKRDSAFRLFRLRGDASMAYDPWITELNLAGQVTTVRRGGKELRIRSRRMPYLIGWLLASATGILKRMIRRMR